MATSKQVSEVVVAMIAKRGLNESGELPQGWAAEIAQQLGVPCDEALVDWAMQAYAHEATR